MDAAQIVDADGHVVERAEELAAHGWSGTTTGHAIVDLLLHRTEALQAAGLCADATPFDAEGRLADMEREGIGLSVNYPTALLLLNQLDATVASELSHAYNNWAYERFTVPTGGRVLTMALVGLGDPDAAVAEARRAVVELGAPGIVVSPFTGHRHLDDPALDPLWALADELDVAVGIHGGRATTEPLLAADSLRDERRHYAIAHPFGQMVAMGDILVGGVLERFPELRVAFLEAGIGWVRWYVDRLDTGVESVRYDRGPQVALTKLPSERLAAGTCFISCEPDEPYLTEMIAMVGEDNVVFSSDYPHFDCAFPESVRSVEKHIGDDHLLRKVTSENARRLYGRALA